MATQDKAQHMIDMLEQEKKEIRQLTAELRAKIPQVKTQEELDQLLRNYDEQLRQIALR